MTEDAEAYIDTHHTCNARCRPAAPSNETFTERMQRLLDLLRNRGHDCRAYDVNDGRSVRILHHPRRDPAPAVTMSADAVYYGTLDALADDIAKELSSEFRPWHP